MMPDGGDEVNHYASHDEGNPNGQRKAIAMLGNSYVIVKCNLAQKKAEAGNHKTESNKRDTSSNPSKEGSFSGQIGPQIVGELCSHFVIIQHR